MESSETRDSRRDRTGLFFGFAEAIATTTRTRAERTPFAASEAATALTAAFVAATFTAAAATATVTTTVAAAPALTAETTATATFTTTTAAEAAAIATATAATTRTLVAAVQARSPRGPRTESSAPGASSTILLRTRHTHAQIASLEVIPVKLPNRLLGLGFGRHRDKTKATGTAGFLIACVVEIFHRTDAFKQGAH